MGSLPKLRSAICYVMDYLGHAGFSLPPLRHCRIYDPSGGCLRRRLAQSTAPQVTTAFFWIKGRCLQLNRKHEPELDTHFCYALLFLLRHLSERCFYCLYVLMILTAGPDTQHFATNHGSLGGSQSCIIQDGRASRLGIYGWIWFSHVHNPQDYLILSLGWAHALGAGNMG